MTEESILHQIAGGERALQERDKALDTWLRKEVAAACDELKADPGRALSVEQVRQHLADKRKRPASA